MAEMNDFSILPNIFLLSSTNGYPADRVFRSPALLNTANSRQLKKRERRKSLPFAMHQSFDIAG
jgi:hypothetical protein